MTPRKGERIYVADLDQESEATRKLYGIDQKVAGPFGRLCLMARRLSETGVRFVQIYGGGGGNWDTHNNIEGQLPGLCEYIDQGMSGLLIDLEQRGMLKDTLVVWSGEFGRLPIAQIGQKAFFDQTLSSGKNMSCASCHSPQFAYGPPNSLAVQLGSDPAQSGARAAPSLRYKDATPPYDDNAANRRGGLAIGIAPG